MPITKALAIDMLGGSPTAAARQLGVSPQAVSQWPAVLTPRIEDRVLGALLRQGRDLAPIIGSAGAAQAALASEARDGA